MTRITRFLLCAAITWAQIGCLARADIAPRAIGGGVSITPKNGAGTNVVMKEEVVNLVLSPTTLDVHVVFFMHNPTDKAERVVVGFPYEIKGELVGFKASVDGQTVKVVDVEGGRRQQSWKEWPMIFAPQTVTEVTVSYSTKVPDFSSELSDSVQQIASLREKVTIAKKQVTRAAVYILKTGAAWAGKIGRCQVVVKLKNLTTDNLTLGSPIPARSVAISKNELRWDIKDFEPREDIRITFTPHTTRAETRQLLESLNERHPMNPFVVNELMLYRIDAGQEAAAVELVQQMFEHWSDKVVMWGPGETDRELVHKSAQIFQMIQELREPASASISRPPRAMIASIERLTKRLLAQSQQADPNSSSVKYYALEYERTLQWCRSRQ